MAERGDAYVTTLRPAQMKPKAIVRNSPCKANRVTRIAVAKKPTSKIPTRTAVLSWNNQKIIFFFKDFPGRLILYDIEILL